MKKYLAIFLSVLILFNVIITLNNAKSTKVNNKSHSFLEVKNTNNMKATYALNKNSSQTKTLNKNTIKTLTSNKNKNMNKNTTNIKQDKSELMKTMFANPISADCIVKTSVNQIGGYATSVKSGSNLTIVRDFSWIKEKWGFGQNCYVYDYLDPVVGLEFITQSEKIYNAVKKFDLESYKDYTDPFITDIIDPTTGQTKKTQMPTTFKENYDPAIYGISVNAVQIKQALETFKWDYSPLSKDPASEFVQKYDINGDTRLSPRELILGVITENSKKYANNGVCYMCFESLIPIIDALFSYMDCDSDGFVGVDNLFKYMPKIKRPTPQWDIFQEKELGIRTKSINDFVLANQKSHKGMLNSQEFRSGLLYGYWNRQTTDYGILEDSSRSMKNLRWTDDGMVDKEIIRYKFQLQLKAEREKQEKEEKAASQKQ